MKFNVGEEVLYQGDRYAITSSKPGEPYQYRIVRTTREGVRVVWALETELSRLAQYVTPRDDTQQLHG